MNDNWPVRLAVHLNPRYFAPHFALVVAQAAFTLLASQLHLSGIYSLISLAILLIAVAPPHHVIVDADSVRIRHWLWRWKFGREDLAEVAWDERERYLPLGHASGASLFALRATVRALELRRRDGKTLHLFGNPSHLEAVEAKLRP